MSIIGLRNRKAGLGLLSYYRFAGTNVSYPARALPLNHPFPSQIAITYDKQSKSTPGQMRQRSQNNLAIFVVRHVAELA
jgi:hypothetical protein